MQRASGSVNTLHEYTRVKTCLYLIRKKLSSVAIMAVRFVNPVPLQYQMLREAGQAAAADVNLVAPYELMMAGLPEETRRTYQRWLQSNFNPAFEFPVQLNNGQDVGALNSLLQQLLTWVLTAPGAAPLFRFFTGRLWSLLPLEVQINAHATVLHLWRSCGALVRMLCVLTRGTLNIGRVCVGKEPLEYGSYMVSAVLLALLVGSAYITRPAAMKPYVPTKQEVKLLREYQEQQTPLRDLFPVPTPLPQLTTSMYGEEAMREEHERRIRRHRAALEASAASMSPSAGPAQAPSKKSS